MKLQRFLSVPIEFELQCGAILSNALGFPMRSNLCSATILRTSPRSLDYKDWRIDTVKTYKGKATCQTDISTMKHEKGSMPVLEVTKRRRCALGDIYQNIRKEDLEHIFAMYDTRLDIETEPSCGQLCKRRPALADIFHDVSQDDMAQILSVFQERLCENDSDSSVLDEPDEVFTGSGRRNALGDIFQGIGEDEKQRIMSGDYLDNDSSESESDENISHYLSRRRGALADIFDNVNMDDLHVFLECCDEEQSFDILTENTENTNQEQCYSSGGRRCALPDIFEGLHDTDLQRIEELCDRVNIEYFAAECPAGQSDNDFKSYRRPGMADIFQDLTAEEIQNVLSICQ